VPQGGEGGNDREGTRAHEPVLLEEALELVAPRAGGVYLDATFGRGGYTQALLRASAPDGRVVAFDRDRDAIESAQRLLELSGDRLSIHWASFADLERYLRAPVDGIVADLGLSSPQLEEPERGFAFGAEGPLDMRFDRSRGPTAAELLNETDEQELERILREFGEERRARAIARRIVARRPLRTTTDLRRAVVGVLGPRRGPTDPATRTFQAIRIAVNREIEALDAFLEKAPGCLAAGGRLVVVSYHSLEDRAVKLAFRARVAAAEGEEPRFRLLTRKPITAGPSELERNRRARSAKLRALERVS
jgi:16S rRNA (cytosine1402-N4)-methyltransferase